MSRKSDMRIDVERFLAMTAMMAAPLLGACGEQADGPGDGSQCNGGKCDEADDPALFACQSVRDAVGGGTADLLGKNDALANLVLKAEGDCPRTYAEVVAALQAAEPDCAEEGSFEGLGSLIVSETAALLGTPPEQDFSRGSYFYRTVTRDTCSGRQPFELLFSQFNVKPGAGVPDNLEVIAMDKIVDDDGMERSIFNYYALEGGEWTFHGNSIDFIEGEGGRCKSCHTSGGLVMKELASPWVHWDPSDSTDEAGFELPGASAIVDGNADLLGSSAGAGATMEEVIVEPGNLEWQDTRVRHLLNKGDLRALLAPMFCATEANLGTGDSSFVPPAALVDARSTGYFITAEGPFSANGISIDSAAYEAAIADQFMTDAHGGPLMSGDGSMLMLNDTDFDMAFPQRAWSDLDMLQKLEQVGVIDAQLQAAIAGVDFTRPVFSDARCSLLGLVDDVGPILGDPADPPADDGGDDDTTDGGTGGMDTSVDAGNCCEVREVDDPTEESSGEPGCSIPAIEECVCAADSFCCDTSWDATCIGLVNTQECLDAVGASAPLCEGFDPADEGGFDGDFGPGTFGEDITVTEGLPDKIRDMLRSKLEAMNPAEGSAEAQLLANLDRPLEDIQGDVDRFIAACDELPDEEFLSGYMVTLSKRRRDAEALPQYEFAATFPQDNRDLGGDPHLDPETCELKR